MGLGLEVGRVAVCSGKAKKIPHLEQYQVAGSAATTETVGPSVAWRRVARRSPERTRVSLLRGIFAALRRQPRNRGGCPAKAASLAQSIGAIPAMPSRRQRGAFP